jgi:hypothetical protein
MEKYIIQTSVDVKNPEADRRSKDWHKLPVIPAASRFIVSASRDGWFTIQSSTQRYGWIAEHSELGKLIVANAERVEPELVRELCEVHGCDWGADNVLRILLKLGRIKPEDFAAVAAVPEDF